MPQIKRKKNKLVNFRKSVAFNRLRLFRIRNEECAKDMRFKYNRYI